MKILLVSDTHGRMDRLFKLSKTLDDIDLIIHLGDNAKDAKELKERKLNDAKVIYVHGNTDGFAEGKDLFKVIDTDIGKMYLTHGHVEGVDISLMPLYYKALEKGCRLACFGHTHIPMCEDVNEVKLINPGSLSKPRNNSNGNYIVMNISKSKVDVEILEYKDEEKEKKLGGYVRNILNYSDRF